MQTSRNTYMCTLYMAQQISITNHITKITHTTTYTIHSALRLPRHLLTLLGVEFPPPLFSVVFLQQRVELRGLSVGDKGGAESVNGGDDGQRPGQRSRQTPPGGRPRARGPSTSAGSG